MILLDTSIIIDFARKEKLEEYEGYCVSIISLAEILKGVPKGKREVWKNLILTLFKVVPLDLKILDIYSEIYYTLRTKGKLISELDFFIAATALAYDLELWTKDKDFLKIKEEFPELKLKLIL